MMHGAPQSGNMNVQDEQSAHEEHGLASRTREKVLTHTRYAAKTHTTAPAAKAPRTATTQAPETATTTTATTENEATKGGLASETRENSRVVWVDLDTDSDVERNLDGGRPARVYSESQKRHRKQVRKAKKQAKGRAAVGMAFVFSLFQWCASIRVPGRLSMPAVVILSTMPVSASGVEHTALAFTAAAAQGVNPSGLWGTVMRSMAYNGVKGVVEMLFNRGRADESERVKPLMLDSEVSDNPPGASGFFAWGFTALVALLFAWLGYRAARVLSGVVTVNITMPKIRLNLKLNAPAAVQHHMRATQGELRDSVDSIKYVQGDN